MNQHTPPREEGLGLPQFLGILLLLVGLAGVGYVAMLFLGLLNNPSANPLTQWLLTVKSGSMDITFDGKKIGIPMVLWKGAATLLVIFILSALGSIAAGVLKTGAELISMDYRKMLEKLYDGLMGIREERQTQNTDSERNPFGESNRM